MRFNCQISRRDLIKGAAATVAAASVLSVPALASKVPILYGDGVHDDTEALQALFNMEPVNLINNGINYNVKIINDEIEPVIDVRNATLIYSDCISLKPGIRIHISHCYMFARKPALGMFMYKNPVTSLI